MPSAPRRPSSSPSLPHFSSRPPSSENYSSSPPYNLFYALFSNVQFGTGFRNLRGASVASEKAKEREAKVRGLELGFCLRRLRVEEL
jgi:hypothetical protein